MNGGLGLGRCFEYLLDHFSCVGLLWLCSNYVAWIQGSVGRLREPTSESGDVAMAG